MVKLEHTPRCEDKPGITGRGFGKCYGGLEEGFVRA
jgi:hypothetical protein